MHTLKFSKGNAKLGKRLIFSLPAGYSCPNAGYCKTFADRTTGQILDLPQSSHATGQEYRCFAAMSEARSKQCRDARWHNWNAIKETIYGEDVRDPQGALEDTIAYGIWQHNAWLEVARQHPDIKFYAYTKQLTYWLTAIDRIPSNFFLTASVGGNLDPMLARYAHVFKRIAHVVYTEQEATDLGLEIDHDDSHCFGDKPFALLVHGVQRKGSLASEALSKRKREGTWTGYAK